jgi:hypothetical protein
MNSPQKTTFLKKNRSAKYAERHVAGTLRALAKECNKDRTLLIDYYNTPKLLLHIATDGKLDGVMSPDYNWVAVNFHSSSRDPIHPVAIIHAPALRQKLRALKSKESTRIRVDGDRTFISVSPTEVVTCGGRSVPVKYSDPEKDDEWPVMVASSTKAEDTDITTAPNLINAAHLFKHGESSVSLQLLEHLTLKSAKGTHSTFEVKRDDIAPCTKNFFCEIGKRVKGEALPRKTAIMISEADWYCIVIGPVIIFVQTKQLQDKAKEAWANEPKKHKWGGDGKNSLAILFKLTEVLGV